MTDLETSRRTFFGLLGGMTVVAGIGVSSASEAASVGYGFGEFGLGEFGIGASRSVEFYADDDGIVRDEGVDDAFEDWERGTITTSLLLDVINAGHEGEPVDDETG